jgi:hypothetical protein
MAYRSFVGSGRLSPASIRRLSQAVVTQIPSYLVLRRPGTNDLQEGAGLDVDGIFGPLVWRAHDRDALAAIEAQRMAREWKPKAQP